jgi:hypothetical protein
LANTTPVTPPTVNKNKNPITYNNGVVNWNDDPYNDPSHENIFTPVGTAIINVAAVKYALESASKPTIYIW